jgi:hypothetical protein
VGRAIERVNIEQAASVVRRQRAAGEARKRMADGFSKPRAAVQPRDPTSDGVNAP